MLTEWKIPTSIEGAEERRRVLVAEIQEIQAQFGNQARKKNTNPEEFNEWRYKAVWAMTNRLEELRLVKQWVKQNTVVTCEHCQKPVYA